jgi:putative NADPH-quinone reductase
MRMSVILGHPCTGSLNHAIAETVVQTLQQGGHTVRYHDLYEEAFDPILPCEEVPKGAPLPPVVKSHCDEIAGADLKGWIDRVIRVGVAFEFAEGDSGEGTPIGLLKAKVALVFTTSNTFRDRETRVFGDPLETVWQNCVFDLCGVSNVHRKNCEVIVVSTPEQRKAWLKDVQEIVEEHFPPTAS